MPNHKLRILVVSGSPWADSNSFGSSYSNIFGSADYRYEIANIYCASGLPDTDVAKSFFQISPRGVLDRILHRAETSGRRVENAPSSTVDDNSTIRLAKRLRWQILYWAQDLLWASGKWRSKELDEFIDDFKPDLVFQPCYYVPHPNRIGVYASKRAGVPIVGYTSDDCYSLRQYSLSPLFWIDRLIKRRLFKKVVDRCRILYVITEKQRKEYDGYFGAGKCKVLAKGGDFNSPPQTHAENTHLRFLYTGNLGTGRAETLADIARALEKCNKQRDEKPAVLDIYSATPLTSTQLDSLNIDGTSTFHGQVSAQEVKRLQAEADVLIHVETFDKTERYKSRLSLSTKIIDYMAAGKPILSAGWAETGAIEYLMRHDATLAITDPHKTDEVVARILHDSELRSRLAYNAYDLGKQNHRIEEIRQNLYTDLSTIIDENMR